MSCSGALLEKILRFVLFASVVGAAAGVLVSRADGAPGDLLMTVRSPWPSAPDGTQGFGDSIAGVGDTIVVGAPHYDPEGILSAGSIFVFDATDGTFVRAINGPSLVINSNFGRTVAAFGDKFIVGSPEEHSHGSVGVVEAGRAFVVDPQHGGSMIILSHSDPGYREHFGSSVAAAGLDVLVGADRHTLGSNVTAVGSAYLCDGDTGSLLREFPNPDPHHLDWFGASVTSLGDRIIVGAPGVNSVTDPTQDRAGRVYLFEKTTGALLSTREIQDVGTRFRFGWAVDAIGENFAVCANESVYLYDGGTLELIRAIHDPNPQPDTVFGREIADVGGDLLVGGVHLEAAHLFDGGTGELLLTLDNPDPTYHYFGSAVGSIGDNDMLVSADGAVYRFEGIPEPSTLILLTMGIVCLLAYGWRRRR